MKKFLKLFITFIFVFCLCITFVYAENETLINESLANDTLTNETNTTIENNYPTNNNVEENINEQHGKYKLLIEDDADLLSEDEETRLKEKMQNLTEFGHIALKTITTNSTSTSSYARQYYYQKFGSESGTVLLIDMDNRIIYIFSNGNNYKIINDSKADIITDNIYRYASRSDYYTCAYQAFTQIEALLVGDKINEPMRFASNIVLSIVFGFFITFIYVFGKSKIKNPKNSEILNTCDIVFDVKNIEVKPNGMHKVYSPRSDSSGSGFSGGGHSGGGGGGHFGGGGGGGGGHRF